jgi:hypothetical protein
MTEKNATELVMVIVRAYPNATRFDSVEAIEDTIALWATQFADDPAELVSMAVKEHIQTSKWPPSIAEIRELMATAINPDLLPPDQAWVLVSDLIAACGEYDSDAALAAMPELIQQAVRSIGWTTIVELHRLTFTKGKPGLDRSAFMDQYKPVYERERIRAQLSPSLRSKLESIEDKAAAGGAKKALQDARVKRIRRENYYRSIQGLPLLEVPEIETTERTLLENRQGGNL